MRLVILAFSEIGKDTHGLESLRHKFVVEYTIEERLNHIGRRLTSHARIPEIEAKQRHDDIKDDVRRQNDC